MDERSRKTITKYLGDMPALVVAELEQDSLSVRDISQASRQMVEDAWNRREYAAVSSQKGVMRRG